jgi:hypothetical protein
MILEIRDMQARLRHLELDARALVPRENLGFAISDLETTIEHLLRVVTKKRRVTSALARARPTKKPPLG